MLKCVFIHCVSHLFKRVISIMVANNNQRVQKTFLLTLSNRVNYQKLMVLNIVLLSGAKMYSIAVWWARFNRLTHTRLVDWIENMAATERVADLRKWGTSVSWGYKVILRVNLQCTLSITLIIKTWVHWAAPLVSPDSLYWANGSQKLYAKQSAS